MSDIEDILPQPAPCNECHAGIMQPRQLTYFTWLGNELITSYMYKQPFWLYCYGCIKLHSIVFAEQLYDA